MEYSTILRAEIVLARTQKIWKIREEKEVQGLIKPPNPEAIHRQKKLIELLVLLENCVSQRGKEISVGEPHAKLWLLSSRSGNLQTENKKVDCLLGLPDNCIGPRGKKISVGEPLGKFQMSYSGIGFVNTLSSEGTSFKNSVAIFIPLITSHFEHPFRLLFNWSGYFSYLSPHLAGFPIRRFFGFFIRHK